MAMAMYVPSIEEKETTVSPRAASAERSARIEAGKPKPKPTKAVDSPTGKFYCQNGDHLVDEVFWLEQIKLGCMDCMVKLRKSINGDTGDTLRIWSVTKDGLQQVPEKKPIPEKPVPKTPAKQTWHCTVCGKYRTHMDGFFNTKLGFVCKSCAGVSNLVGAGKNIDNRVKRGGEQMITGRDLVLKEVLPYQAVAAGGGGATIMVEGDVGAHASLHAAGGGARIEVHGYIHEHAKLYASGGGAIILHHGADTTASIRVSGGGSQILDRTQKRIAENLAKSEGPVYAWTQEVERLREELTSGRKSIYRAREDLARVTKEFQADVTKDFVSCDTCGKSVKPVSGWNSAKDLARCGECWRGASVMAEHTAYAIVKKKKDLPQRTRQGDTAWVAETKQLMRFIDDQWVQIALPSQEPTDHADQEYLDDLRKVQEAYAKERAIRGGRGTMSWYQPTEREMAMAKQVVKARRKSTSHRGAR